jgi:hypothetical protein
VEVVQGDGDVFGVPYDVYYLASRGQHVFGKKVDVEV